MSPRGGAGAGPVSAEAARGAHLGTQPGSRPHPRRGAQAAAGETEASREPSGAERKPALHWRPHLTVGLRLGTRSPSGEFAEERV